MTVKTTKDALDNAKLGNAKENPSKTPEATVNDWIHSLGSHAKAADTQHTMANFKNQKMMALQNKALNQNSPAAAKLKVHAPKASQSHTPKRASARPQAKSTPSAPAAKPSTPRAQAPSQSKSERVMVMTDRQLRRVQTKSTAFTGLHMMGVGLSILWMTAVLVYVDTSIGWGNLWTFLPHEMGGFLAGALTPIALFWLMLTMLLRGQDVRAYAEAMRAELQSMMFPSEAAERRVNSDIEKLMRQQAEMSKATQSILSAISQARRGLQDDIKKMQGLGGMVQRDMMRVTPLLSTQLQTMKEIDRESMTIQKAIEKASDSSVASWREKLGGLLVDVEKLQANLSDGLSTMTMATDQAHDKVARSSDRLQNLSSTMLDSANDVVKQLEDIFIRFEDESRHIHNAAEATEISAQRLTTTVGSAVEELSNLGTVMSDATSQAQGMLLNERQALIAEAEASAHKVSKELEAIIQTAKAIQDDSLSKLESMSGTVSNVMSQAQAELHNERQALIADAESSAHAVSKELQAIIDIVRDTNLESVQSVDEAHTRLASERDALMQAADTAGQAVQAIAGTLSDTTMELSRHTDDMASRSNVIETVLGERTQAMNEAAELLEARTGVMSDKLSQQMSEIHQLISDSEIRLDTSGGHLQSVISSLNESETGVRDAVQDLSSAMQGEISMLDDRLARLTDQGDALRQSSSAVLEDLDNLSAKMDEMVINYDGSVADLHKRLQAERDNLVASAQEMRTALDEPYEELTQMTEKAGLRAKEVRFTMGEIGRDLVENVNETIDRADALLGRLGDQAQSYAQTGQRVIDQQSSNHDKLVDQTNFLAKEVADTVMSLRDLSEMMAKTVVSLENTAQHSQGVLEDHADRISEQQQLVAEESSKAQNRLSDVETALVGSRETVENQIKLSEESLAALMGRYQAHSDQLVETSQSSQDVLTGHVRELGQVHEQYQSVSDLVNKKIETSMATFKSMGENFAAEQSNIAEALQGSSDRVQKTLADWMSHLDRGYERFDEVNAGLDSHASSVEELLARLTDQSNKAAESLDTKAMAVDEAFQQGGRYLEEMQKAFDAGLETANAHVSEHMSLLDQVSNRLSGQIGSIREELSQLFDKSDATSADMLAVLNQWQSSGEGLHNGLVSMRSELEDQVSAIHEAVTEASRDQQRLLTGYEGLGQVSREQSEAAQIAWRQAFDAAEGYQQERLSQASAMINGLNERLQSQSDVIADMLDAMATVTAQVTTLSQATENERNQTIHNVEALREKFDSGVENLSKTTERGEKVFEQVVVALDKSRDSVTQKVVEAVKEMEQTIEKLASMAEKSRTETAELQKRDSRMRRDVFLSSTKFVVESLHSLSLDFTRMMEGELPEKTWRAYQKGEHNAFTKRLLSLKSDDQSSRIRAKYRDDSEFRSYVLRYVRQYEEMLDQAIKVDHADLLQSVFVSSDIGRLYRFVCDAIGRSAATVDARATTDADSSVRKVA